MNFAKAEAHGLAAALVAETMTSPFFTRLMSALIIAVITTTVSKLLERLFAKKDGSK